MRKFRELNADTKQRISQALKGRGLTDNHKPLIGRIANVLCKNLKNPKILS